MRWRAIAAGLCLMSAPLASGCGFTPLYAVQGVSPGLASIDVVTPEGRTGHLLSEDLQDDLAITNGSAPAYRLNLAVDETRYERGLNIEQLATWYELQVRVSYSLVDIASGRTLTAGVTPITVSYGAAEDPYAGIIAQQDGQKRAASEAAQRIRMQLAAWFADRARAH